MFIPIINTYPCYTFLVKESFNSLKFHSIFKKCMKIFTRELGMYNKIQFICHTKCIPHFSNTKHINILL